MGVGSESWVPCQKGVGVGPVQGSSQFTASTKPHSDEGHGPWSFGKYGEESKVEGKDAHKWWREGKSHGATAYRSQVGDVERFWGRVQSGRAKKEEVMGTADFAALKRELQKSHMHMRTAEGGDAYRSGSAYRQQYSDAAGPMHEAQRAQLRLSTYAAGRNKAQAMGASVQDALREDL